MKELWNTIINLMDHNPYLMEKFLSVIPSHLARLIPFFGKNTPVELIYYVNLFRSFERARFLYKSNTKINQPLIYIGAKDEIVENYTGWEKYTNSYFYEQHIKGDHTTIFNNENIVLLAEAINKYLS